MVQGWGTAAVCVDVRFDASSETKPRKKRSLAGQFLLVAFAVMLVGMFAMGTLVSWQIEKSVAELKAASTALYINTFIAPHLQEITADGALSPDSVHGLKQAMERPDLQPSITSVRIWNHDGVIVHSDDQALIGKKFTLPPSSRKAWTGAIAAEFDDIPGDEEIVERFAGLPLLKVFAPIRSFESGNVIAVVEFHERAEALNSELIASEWKTWLSTALITLNMMGCLFVIVANGSKTIDRQRAALTERVSQLSELLRQNRILQGRIERAAQNATEDNERTLRRMGYDLHDGVAQLVSLALLRLDRIQGSRNDQDNLQKIQKALSDALNDTRNICKGLLLPEVQTLTLKEALLFMMRQHERRTGTEITCKIADLPEEAPQFVKIALCRYIQESLNNAFKHADGREQHVEVSWDGSTVTVEVADNGPGMSEESGSIGEPRMGLAGLRDRIESIGGALSIKSTPGNGTRIKASLPLIGAGGADAA
ncbi:sensor histidine kinase [Microvirga sp. 3-52]|uniref:sensor histidine kinase n=1 Tax=Microvirga sp. 3-52 TaxID=2792425 RepID=UPI001ACE1801|nr:sensor histidine kinase [Microvirga sp. 3-52]MBO1904307.1 sensor histidine kinase [Microvirga sp. 3-52]MBS7451521.1 sensor histidine kinase [Microvirga sp. 3-52]